MPLDDLPVAGKVRVGGRALEDDGRDTEEKRSVDDVSMSCDPTHVTTAEEDVLVVDIENVFSSHGGTEKVAGGRVHDTLGLASGAGGVEEEKRVF